MAGGFTEEGLAALDAALARHASSGAVPGLVALVARGGQVHVTTAGHLAAGIPRRSAGRDLPHRVADQARHRGSGNAAVQDGAMALDNPVERWLPELAGAACCGPTTPSCPTRCRGAAGHGEDVLSFRLGFGCIFTPQALPVIKAEAELGLKTLGPPWPPTPLTPGQWIAALGSLPLLDQPGDAGATTQARRSPGSSSSGSPGRRSPRCSASGCSSRSA